MPCLSTQTPPWQKCEWFIKVVNIFLMVAATWITVVYCGNVGANTYIQTQLRKRVVYLKYRTYPRFHVVMWVTHDNLRSRVALFEVVLGSGS